MKKLGRQVIENIERLRMNGYSYREIAKKLALSVGSSYNYAKNIKISELGKKRLLIKYEKKIKRFVNKFAKPKKINIPENITSRLGRIISHCVFDGSVVPFGKKPIYSKPIYSVIYTNSGKELVDQFVKDIWLIFKLRPSYHIKYFNKNAYTYQVLFNSKELVKFLQRFTPSYSTLNLRCKLAQLIFKQNDNFTKEFLRAFWEDDGSIPLNGSIEGCCKSKFIIKQLQILHQRVGIKTTIRFDRKSNLWYIRVPTSNRRNISVFYHKVCPIYSISKSKYERGKLKREIFIGRFGNKIMPR